MKRYLIPVLVAILALASVLVTGCGDTTSPPAEQSNAKLEAYLEKVLPIVTRHVETTETTNQANRAFVKAASSGTEVEMLEALLAYKETLDWALNRADSELADFKKLKPPPEAQTYHSLMIEALVKEQGALGDTLSYYSSVLRYGLGNDEALTRANNDFLEAQKIYLQAQYELQNLMQKVEQLP